MNKLMTVNDEIDLREIYVARDQASKMKREGWLFDWHDEDSNFRTIAAISSFGIEGLVSFEQRPKDISNYIKLIELAPHNIGKRKRIPNVAGILFAYVASESFKAGFEGYVYFDSKTILMSHYMKTYGAEYLRENRLVFNTKCSVKLIKRFLWEEKK